MPAELRESLREAAPPAEPFWAAPLRELRAGLSHRGSVVTFAVVGSLALLLWGRSSGWLQPRLEVPVDLLVAAHNQYVLTMPLAPAEKIQAELPVVLAGDAVEERDVY